MHVFSHTHRGKGMPSLALLLPFLGTGDVPWHLEARLSVTLDGRHDEGPSDDAIVQMATIPIERALVKLGSELEKLGRQIERLLEKQAELTQEKTRLEAARDAAYSAVSTPSSRRLSATAILTRAPGWERQRGRGRQPASSPLPQPDFSSANPFEVLSSGSSTSPSPAPAPKKNKGGARVLDVARRLPSALKQRDDFGTVVLHVGAVDTFARRSEILKDHYRSLLDTARKKTSARLVVSGPLPTFRRGCELFSRLFCLHSWLRDTCGSVGVDYVDNWESFRERPSLYRRDGLHPSRLGSAVLSRNIEDVLRRA
ncbi:uncharacterized protein LOC143517666 isoform X2 [Brachyhypopomus gauderio]|uniref:uncharacterized protein LOC143517666 isoform X2 n=1 Tax=Brachyhypopomus gauderio TaxID=698409 RepID=UPI00404266FD